MKIQVTKSINVDKTNTLHQFDPVGIIGVQSPVGKIPIIFYIKEGPERGRQGIIYYDDYDTVCFHFPENEHAEWCEQPYDIKYDAVETYDNGVESGYRRNHGIFELWVEVFRKWYNGQIMYRPKKKIKGCGGECGGYPAKAEEETALVKPKTVKTTAPAKQNINHSCGCRK